jgi:hypothetical protein
VFDGPDANRESDRPGGRGRPDRSGRAGCVPAWCRPGSPRPRTPLRPSASSPGDRSASVTRSARAASSTGPASGPPNGSSRPPFVIALRVIPGASPS